MKYKAIILDLDDTTVLHGVGNLPSPRVTEAIQKASEILHVSIATGRTLSEAKSVIDHLHLTGPCIISNGAQIYNPLTDKIFHQIFLPEHTIPLVYEICQANHLQLILHTDTHEGLFAGAVFPQNVLRMYIPRIKPHKTDMLVDKLKKINGINVQKMPAWTKGFMSIDMTNISASKLHGIVEVARILRIETSEIIGVGDGYNDFPLLLACGLKIAMGNAVGELKTIADFTAPSVVDDGVATVIEKFVLTR